MKVKVAMRSVIWETIEVEVPEQDDQIVIDAALEQYSKWIDNGDDNRQYEIEVNSWTYPSDES